MEIRIIRINLSAAGTMNDFVGDRVEDLVAEVIANMFRDANNVTNFFTGIRRETRFQCLTENFLPEYEAEKNTDVNSDAK